MFFFFTFFVLSFIRLDRETRIQKDLENPFEPFYFIFSNDMVMMTPRAEQVDLPLSYQKNLPVVTPAEGDSAVSDGKIRRRRWTWTAAVLVGVAMLYLCSTTAQSMSRASMMLSLDAVGGLWSKSPEKKAAKAQKRAEKNQAKAAKKAKKAQAKQEKKQAKEQYLAEHPQVAEEKAAIKAYWKQKGKEYKDYWKSYANQTATNWTAKGEEYKAMYANMTNPSLYEN